MKKIIRYVYNQTTLLQNLGLRHYLRYFFAKRGSQIELRVCGKDITIRQGTHDLIVAQSCFSGEFEILRYLLPSNYDGVIVDAGGYIGTAALVLNDMFPEARIVCIEPSIENISVLKKNVSAIRNIEIVFGALVGAECESILLRNRGSGEWGFTAVESPLDNIESTLLHETPAYTLKQLGVPLEQIGIVKLDIEGGELDLMVNDSESMLTLPIVFAELHDRIVDGCTDQFFKFSENRILVKDSGEKYLSIKN